MTGKEPALETAPEWLGSPAFQAAVSAAVEAQVAKIAEQLAAARSNASSSSSDGDTDFVARLALEIAKLSDQGTGRKHVDPAIVASRNDAAQRLRNLLVDMRARGEMPEWQLRNKIQVVLADIGETVLEPMTVGDDRRPRPVEIAYLGVPNLAMAPLNQSAHEVFALFCESTGSAAQPQPAPDLALTPGGVVVQGRAAASIINRDSTRAHRNGLTIQVGSPDQHMPHAAATVRHGGPEPVVETRVLGSLAMPARQMA